MVMLRFSVFEHRPLRDDATIVVPVAIDASGAAILRGKSVRAWVIMLP